MPAHASISVDRYYINRCRCIAHSLYLSFNALITTVHNTPNTQRKVSTLHKNIHKQTGDINIGKINGCCWCIFIFILDVVYIIHWVCTATATRAVRCMFGGSDEHWSNYTIIITMLLHDVDDCYICHADDVCSCSVSAFDTLTRLTRAKVCVCVLLECVYGRNECELHEKRHRMFAISERTPFCNQLSIFPSSLSHFLSCSWNACLVKTS